MVFISRVAAAVAVASVAVSANPVEPRASTITVPLQHVSSVNSAKSLVDRGLSRLRKINSGHVEQFGHIFAASGPATNEAVSYTANITIGGKPYSLVVDTGSSNLWCGAQAPCEPSKTGRDTGNSVSVGYGSGSFSGEEYVDRVSFAGLTVRKQSVGAANHSTGFEGVDGIIGFGPTDLTLQTVNNTKLVKTFMDNLYSQGSIASEVLGVSFRPVHGSSGIATNGELTLGGIDHSRYRGPLTYYPKLKTGDASYYWGIAVDKFTYNRTTVLGSSNSAIVDTGTTLIYIPTPAFNAFLAASGGELDATSGLVRYSVAPKHYFGINFGGETYTLVPAQYLVPQSQYEIYGLTEGYYYSWINDGGEGGVDTIIGQKFMENYYAVFDTTKSRIGFAKGI